MKLINLAILFIMIVFPFIYMNGVKAQLYHEDTKLRVYYDQVIDNAVQDAAFIWAGYQKKASYDSFYSTDNTREIAVKALTDSLFYSMGVYGNPSGMARIKSAVPVILFLEEDGYYLYGLTEYKGPDGHTIIDYCWYPKHPYVGEGITGSTIIRYTLGDNVYIYDYATGQESLGAYYDFSDVIPDFGSKERFEVLKLSAVSKTIEKDLKAFIGQLNLLSRNMGVTYEFHFPRIDESDWRRALVDQSILVFAQGLPVLTGNQYEMEAFGGARIMRAPSLVGYSADGIKTYCREECTRYLNASLAPGFDPKSIIYFSTAIEAASNGYYPCDVCRP